MFVQTVSSESVTGLSCSYDSHIGSGCDWYIVYRKMGTVACGLSESLYS